MESRRTSPPVFIGTGTLTQPHDMVRALETIESFAYRHLVNGSEISAGRATLVRLMYDNTSATTLVNGCLFLNVASLRYLDFTTDEAGTTLFVLFGDGMTLEIVPINEREPHTEQRQAMRMMEEAAFDDTTYVSLDDEDDDF